MIFFFLTSIVSSNASAAVSVREMSRFSIPVRRLSAENTGDFPAAELHHDSKAQNIIIDAIYFFIKQSCFVFGNCKFSMDRRLSEHLPDIYCLLQFSHLRDVDKECPVL